LKLKSPLPIDQQMASTSKSLLELRMSKPSFVRQAFSIRNYTFRQLLSMQQRGYYRTEDEDSGTIRTLLLDFLEDSPRFSKQQLAPVVRYFELILESCKNLKLRSFTLFPKLPPEIRQMIWKYALPGERIFEVSCWVGNFPRSNDLRASHAPLLKLLSVCREASSVVQQNYQKLRIQDLGEGRVSSKYFYLLVNYKKDIFYFSGGYMRNALKATKEIIEAYWWRADTYKIGIIAFDMSSFRFSTIMELDPPSLGYMRDLREVLFVQNRREFLPDTHQQDSGRPLVCTRSKKRDESFSKLHPDATAAIDETLAIPKIAEIYKNIRTSFVIFRPFVQSPNQRVST
jgi:hypothetical protein